jgi:hypothetical protein
MSCTPNVLSQPSQSQGNLNDRHVSTAATIVNLPEDVFLEVFDSYRQILRREPYYRRAWNGKDGWLKLAHVCREWRQVVLTSPARLHMRLLFTEHTS